MKMLLPIATTLLLAISGCSKAAPEAADKKAPAPVAAATQQSDEITGNAPESVRKAIVEHLKTAEIPAHINAITSTELPNIYWVTFDDVPPVFISGDGQFLLQGNVVKLGKGTVTNVSDALNATEAKRLLATVADKDMIIFSPKGKPKAVVYAFTDVDCGYCRKLHAEMDQINAKGIEVRYLAWPRSPADVAVNKAVWCSEDRKSAITTAKHGLPVQAPACADPVMAQRQIGMKIGVNGTPALYTVDGDYLGGYIPADDLAKALKIAK
ncbi:DsbC family protein [Aquirhabdus parva]|uniref:Thiol:disulfide interchange protein n=1 Tax=Aquirhabdus parva TaxID=2283318 RepID=A0A345P305_9GAMM|nr:DsbC family protein [Aquirhabdus parva]AXI01664.1 DsbC family protein [Aquirhabdus parva]